jgi:hypothetical protein
MSANFWTKFEAASLVVDVCCASLCLLVLTKVFIQTNTLVTGLLSTWSSYNVVTAVVISATHARRRWSVNSLHKKKIRLVRFTILALIGGMVVVGLVGFAKQQFYDVTKYQLFVAILVFLEKIYVNSGFKSLFHTSVDPGLTVVVTGAEMITIPVAHSVSSVVEFEYTEISSSATSGSPTAPSQYLAHAPLQHQNWSIDFPDAIATNSVAGPSLSYLRHQRGQSSSNLTLTEATAAFVPEVNVITHLPSSAVVDDEQTRGARRTSRHIVHNV